MNLDRFLRPLNFFEVHGHFCCERMYEAYGKSNLAGSSFLAASIFEANAVVLWGSFSKKLINAISEPLKIGSKKYLIHIQGCEARVSNLVVFSSLKEFLPIDKELAFCEFSKVELELLLKEARQCLKA